MNQQISNYLKYGIFNNVLCFPYNRKTIKTYVKELDYLREALEKEHQGAVIHLLKKEDSNIFIVSFVAYVYGLNEEIYRLLSSKIRNRYDLYIAVNFLKNSKHFDRKAVDRLYQDKIGIIGDYKDILFDICKPKGDTMRKFRKRNKILFEIKKEMDTGEVDADIVAKIRDNQIHPSEIGYYMSYYFDLHYKEQIALYFLNTYGVLEILPRIDSWFIDIIPEKINESVKEALYNLTKIDDIITLLIIYKKMNNVRLKGLIDELFQQYHPDVFTKNLHVYVAATQRSGMKVDKSEKFDYLYLIGINSTLLSAEFASKIYVNNQAVEGTIMEKLERFDARQIALKPVVNRDEEVTSILFSTINEPGFDILWDITAEQDVSFKNNGPLFIKGRNVLLLPCLFKYLKEN